jgi:hypothetical protein
MIQVVYAAGNFNKNSLVMTFLQGLPFIILLTIQNYGPVLDNKTKTGCHIVTEEKLDSNGVRPEHLPRKWLAKEAQQLDVSIFSASTNY